MNQMKFSSAQLLLAALRAYLDSRHKRFAVDQELMDSAGKCAMFLEINNRLCLLERSSFLTASVVCKVVDDYGRLMYDYRARRNAAHQREDVRHLAYIYELYDALKDHHGGMLWLAGSAQELTYMYNQLCALGLEFTIRPLLDGEALAGQSDWCIVTTPEAYQMYKHHVNVSGYGHHRH
jgi:hypothetical protein